MGRHSNRAQRRGEIVDGLMRVLPRVGYERATIAKIAKAAGLSAGLVHHHFENKQAILLALGERLDQIVAERRREARTPRTRLFAFLDAHLALDGDDGDAPAHPVAIACWVAIGAEAVVQPEVGALYRRLIAARRDELRGLLEAVLKDEGGTTRGLDATTATLLATVEGIFQLATAAPDTIPPGSAAGSVRRLAEHLLDSHAPRSST